jgi:hypothetical protein
MQISIGMPVGYPNNAAAATGSLWVAPAWSVDASGYAYADPTLGAELFINGAFGADTDWTKGTGWTIAGGVAVGANTSGNLTQGVGVIGKLHRLQFTLATRTAGTLFGRMGFSLFPVSAPGTYVQAATSISTTVGIGGTTFSGTVDNVSCKLVENPFALLRKSPTKVGIKYPAVAYGNLSGLIMCANAAIEPTSYVRLARSTATASGIDLAKFVNGVRTSLITPTAITFDATKAIELRRPTATTFEMWYDGVQVGTTQTVSDVEIVSNEWCGLVSVDSAEKISEFQIDGVRVPFRF